MPITPAKSFRFPPELLERVDRYAARLSDMTGVPIPRNEMVMHLLTMALNRVEGGARRKRRLRTKVS